MKETLSLLAMVLCYCSLMCVAAHDVPCSEHGLGKEHRKTASQMLPLLSRVLEQPVLNWLKVSCPSPDFGAWSGLSDRVTPVV